MSDTTKEPVVCRYYMYDNPERTKAWRLDVVNHGKCARFSVNGKEVIAPRENEAAVLLALTVLDTAFGDLMLNTIGVAPSKEEL